VSKYLHQGNVTSEVQSVRLCRCPGEIMYTMLACCTGWEYVV